MAPRCPARRGRPLGPRAAPAPSTHARCREAPAPPREPRPALCPRVGGSPLDRRGDASPARQPGGELARGTSAAPRQLSPRVRSRLGWQDLLPPAPDRPLAAGECRRTAPGLGGRRRRARPLKRLLIKRTEGNPFFLEESVRTLVETGALAGERGAYRLIKDAPAIQVPATVQALLAGRIDRLPPAEKRLLQAASVIGKDVPFTLLQAIVEDGEGDLHHGLAHLQAAEFLYESH